EAATWWYQTNNECVTFTDLGLPDAFLGTDLKVRLLLHTRDNLNCGKLLSHLDPSAQPLFNVSRPTTFIVHGFRPTGEPPEWLHMAVRLLAAIDDMNIVLVDWNRGATNLNYFTVVSNTRKAADNITSFIQKMEEDGASLASIHMIGVSLGAHISGFVGAKLKGQIGRITALDPAGPQFTGTPPEDRLDSTDAQFVDVIHSDMDALGFRKPLGHIDFYPNGGADQPGCPSTIFSGKEYFKCDHQRSVFLFLNSMNATCNITTYPCASYDDFLDAKCLSCPEFTPSGCPAFGYYTSEWKDTLLRLGQTSTYFSTTTKSPFCKTNYVVEMVTWNSEPRWATVTVKLHSKEAVTEARINHKASKFQQYKETRLLAQFDQDLHPIQRISLQFSSGNIVGPRYKLRLLRFRLEALELPDRPQLCRYDIVLTEKMEVSFRPIPCEDTNF
uniref:Lipase, member Ia n=1 Tax=Scleropages formosus TaxID=113540 RepID=A0A8C9RQA3_SCLFO